MTKKNHLLRFLLKNKIYICVCEPSRRIAISLIYRPARTHKHDYDYNNDKTDVRTYLCADLFVCRTLTWRLRSETHKNISIKHAA